MSRLCSKNSLDQRVKYMKVSVYFNLHKKCLSVRSHEKENYGRVIEHCQQIGLVNVDFIVNPSGRNKVLKEKKKNVHAFVRGHQFLNFSPNPNKPPILVTYNPYLYNTFVEQSTEKPIYQAKYVTILGKKIFAYLE